MGSFISLDTHNLHPPKHPLTHTHTHIHTYIHIHLVFIYLYATPVMRTYKTVLSSLYRTPLIPNNQRNNTRIHVWTHNIIILKTMLIIISSIKPTHVFHQNTLICVVHTNNYQACKHVQNYRTMEQTEHIKTTITM